MRINTSRAALALAIALALPGGALAQASHNTARSNKSTVPPPAGDTAPAPANINTSRGNTKARNTPQ